MSTEIHMAEDAAKPPRISPAKPGRTWKILSSEWLVPAGLLLLSLVPMLAGSVRLVELGGGAQVTAENARFFDAPMPVVMHIISVSFYAVLGAFQFAPRFRLRYPRWHRRVGRLLLPLGMVAALSGLWMSHFYDLPEMDGELLYIQRLLFGTAMFLSLCLGYIAARRRDFAQHGAWMIRAYAIGMGAGTQAFTHLPWFILFGTPTEFPRAILMGAGWVINLLVAEWVISRRLTRPTPNPRRATLQR